MVSLGYSWPRGNCYEVFLGGGMICDQAPISSGVNN